MSAPSSRASAASTSASSAPGCASPGRSSSTPTAGRSSAATSPKRSASRTSARSAPTTSKRSTSSAAASPVKTSAPPGGGRASMEPARVFGPSSPGSFASYDPATSSWRTSPPCSPGRASAGTGRRSAEFSETWPRQGMTRSGRACRLESSGHPTCESGSGSWPTQEITFPTPSASEPDAWRYVEVVDKDGNPPSHPNQRFYDKKTGRVVQKTLEHVALTWPTPTARLGTARGPQAKRYWDPRRSNDLDDAVAAMDRPGQLNPTWVEWLMGFPIGWTALPPSETPSSRRSRSGSGGASSPTSAKRQPRRRG